MHKNNESKKSLVMEPNEKQTQSNDQKSYSRCGRKHQRNQFSAINSKCRKCAKIGHWEQFNYKNVKNCHAAK